MSRDQSDSQGQETDSGFSGEEPPSYATEASVKLKEFLENTVSIFHSMSFVIV